MTQSAKGCYYPSDLDHDLSEHVTNLKNREIPNQQIAKIEKLENWSFTNLQNWEFTTFTKWTKFKKFSKFVKFQKYVTQTEKTSLRVKNIFFSGISLLNSACFAESNDLTLKKKIFFTLRLVFSVWVTNDCGSWWVVL